MILTKDFWTKYEIVKDCNNKIKIFSCESEAIDYAKIKNLYIFQLIEITI